MSNLENIASTESLRVSIRQYVERVMDERDRLYTERFRSAGDAMHAAMDAAEKRTLQSFQASEKAIGKAEDAQREYNIRSNEFRGQLDDQAKGLMPRTESLTMYKAIESKLDELKSLVDRNYEIALKEISSLRESRKEIKGRDEGVSTSWSVLISIVSLFVGGTSLISSIFIFATRNPVITSAPVQPSVIYVPSPAGTLLPSTPPATVPR